MKRATFDLGLIVQFFSTVPGKNFDLCIMSTRTKTH